MHLRCLDSNGSYYKAPLAYVYLTRSTYSHAGYLASSERAWEAGVFWTCSPTVRQLVVTESCCYAMASQNRRNELLRPTVSQQIMVDDTLAQVPLHCHWVRTHPTAIIRRAHVANLEYVIPEEGVSYNNRACRGENGDAERACLHVSRKSPRSLGKRLVLLGNNF